MEFSGILVGGIAVSGLITVGCYSANARFRASVDHAVTPLRVPERRQTYTAKDLQEFRSLSFSRPTTLGRSALEVYRQRVLLLDCGFAAGLGVFSLLCWFAASSHLTPSFSWIAWFCGFWSVFYGFVDVGEDIMLRMLLNPNLEITEKKADGAATLTRLKFISITLSLVAVTVWALLGLLDKIGLFGVKQTQDSAS